MSKPADKEMAASRGEPRTATTTTLSQQFTMLVRVKTLNGKRIVLTAAKHNLREIQAEIGADSHIDASRISDNYIIAGSDTAAGVAEYERELLSDAEFPQKLRKNTIRAVEMVFSLPSDSAINHRNYFMVATEWARKFYNVPILSSVVHLDESAPHCHVLMLPLVDGKMQGSALLGDRARLLAMQSDFHECVAGKFGLAKQAAQKRLSASVRRDMAGRVFALIKSCHDLLNEPNVRDALVELIAANPVRLATAVNLDIPEPQKPSPKTFVEIMTKPQKPEKKTNTIGNQSSNTIGLQPKNDHSLSCVGFADSPPAIISTEPDPSACSDDGYRRVHDEDQQAGAWDYERGEFVIPASKQRETSPAIEQTRAQIISLQARRQA